MVWFRVPDICRQAQGLWADTPANSSMPKRKSQPAASVEYDADKCRITGSGVKYSAREKDFIYHIHDNLLD
ncbi:uncharacterized protein METZ01_LOCUS283912, partial [marine metagenome]